jgi:hypothetical protein
MWKEFNKEKERRPPQGIDSQWNDCRSGWAETGDQLKETDNKVIDLKDNRARERTGDCRLMYSA